MKINSFFANNNSTVDEDDLRRVMPSIFATAPHADCSERYEFIDTARIMGYLTEEGYKVASAQAGLRGKSREFGIHTVRMRAPFNGLSVGDLFPEIVITNSHDRTSRATMDLGLYRTACSNGLVVGTSAGLRFSIPHIGDQRDSVITAASKVLEHIPRITEVVATWGQRVLTDAEQEEFNRRALVIKGTKGVVNLMIPRRDADVANSLWNCYNRVQENILGGGQPYRNENGRRAQTRPIGSVKKALDTNQRLWELASDFLPC